MGKAINRLDANEQSFFKRQTEYIKTKTYDVIYEDLLAFKLIPVSTAAPTGAKFVTFRSYGKMGVAKIIESYAKDFPRVDVYGTEQSRRVHGIGSAYGYSIQEIREAQMAQVNLETRRAEAARRAIDEKMDALAWEGDDSYNITGFIDYTGITEATLTTGTGGNTWALKTPDEIIADLTALKNAVSVPTKGKWNINQIILPRTQYNLISDKRMTDGNSKTVKTYFMDNNPGVQIDVLDRLSTAGASSTTRMMGYVRDSRVLEQEIPQMFEQFEADKEGMEYEIPCHGRTAGVQVYYPEACCYLDGI